jgi:hypothetical protein
MKEMEHSSGLEELRMTMNRTTSQLFAIFSASLVVICLTGCGALMSPYYSAGFETAQSLAIEKSKDEFVSFAGCSMIADYTFSGETQEELDQFIQGCVSYVTSD